MKETYKIDKCPLVKNLLLLEGHGRSGKFLLGNIVDGFERVEHYQYVSFLEHVSHLQMLGLIQENVAQYLLKLIVDKSAHNMMTGRDLNFRYSDKSSLHKSFDVGRYTERIYAKDSPKEIISNFVKENRLSVFVTHDMMTSLQLFLKTFKGLRVIRLIRHPIDLVHSWYLRKWCMREGKDPTSFQPCFILGNNSVPWHAFHWRNKYLKLPQMDRIIQSLKNLSLIVQKNYQSLTVTQRKKILVINYENLVENTDNVIERIGEFLNSVPLKHMPLILRREKCPVEISSTGREKKIDQIRKKASKKMFKIMMHLAKEYEKNSQCGTWVQ